MKLAASLSEATTSGGFGNGLLLRTSHVCLLCNPPLRPPACLRLSTTVALGAGYFIELVRQTHSCPPYNPPS
jgi:hypothetical protein